MLGRRWRLVGAVREARRCVSVARAMREVSAVGGPLSACQRRVAFVHAAMSVLLHAPARFRRMFRVCRCCAQLLCREVAMRAHISRTEIELFHEVVC